ncbi:sodium:proton antiporter [Candidatus Venteria ishoeyi]|uniref:Na(+)/H(+) antiporter subunit C1 n=1 Tax=Candidatus Venteria ishoeyi TaxID=1899563 RepID=A0A1H6FC96_9GAMM|nr:sodium:proton antiporter [Candidatus Venteria ishoeyi]MDM8547075.1 sodium:proton antiporter [Candidatus Venteria ishoeyi]SEH07712.1 Na(+)/H(+) antiporter subunit C1 [Candidatus Venteria ishoeyi]
MTDDAGWIYIFAYLGVIGLLLLGLLTMLIYRNVIRILLGLVLVESAINLLLVTIGFHPGGIAPILESGQTALTTLAVDPIPQALVLTAIVIGVGVQALALSLVIKVYRFYGTLDIQEIANITQQQSQQLSHHDFTRSNCSRQAATVPNTLTRGGSDT